MPTPLYDALCRYAGQNPLRLHMPGHKGKGLPEWEKFAQLDVTELPATGNLYEAGEPFDQAQKLWADVFGFEHAQFLTGGSTMGIHTGLALLCRPGDQILVDRGCHRAVYNALALLDLEPVFLERPWLPEENLMGHISPELVENCLRKYPKIKTVCITSPTYSGVLSDIRSISHIVHQYGAKLFVDGAHGAHLPFLGLEPFSGADAVVVSAHKTLPALGQGALLFTQNIDPELVRRTASVYGTSSPSYPILASMDLARSFLLGEEGSHALRRTACRVMDLRQRFPSLTGGPDLHLDPTRLTLNVENGPAFAQALERRGIFPEMEDGGHVVLICTAQDSPEEFQRLEEALEALRDQMGPCGRTLPPPPLPAQVLTPRQAMFVPCVRRPLQDCEGEISAGQVAPYPPGVPVVAPGEVFGKKELAYFREIGYNMEKSVWTVCGGCAGGGMDHESCGVARK